MHAYSAYSCQLLLLELLNGDISFLKLQERLMKLQQRATELTGCICFFHGCSIWRWLHEHLFLNRIIEDEP